MPVLYGVLNERDIYNDRVTGVGVSVIDDAIQASVVEHNRQLNALIALFVRNTTDFKVKFKTETASRLQPLDSSGRARPIKPAGQYDVAFPIHMGGAAWGTDYVTGVKMNVGDVARITAMMQNADMRWIRDHLLGALMYKNGTSPWVFSDPAHGDLNISGLANADGVTYQFTGGADQNGADDHLKAATTLTADVFIDIRNELTEHPENTGEVIAFIPTNLRATTEALPTYFEKNDPNLQLGSGQTRLTGTLQVAIPGELIGYCEGVWIVEWKSMPDNYIIGRTTGGDAPLAFREDEEAELRGFHKIPDDRNDHPWYERQYIRRGGFGAWNRVGAVVYRIGNASYAIPAGYESPMA